MNSTKTKSGRVSVYGLACGYIELHETPGCKPGFGQSLTLWHEGGPNYHVRQHDHTNGKRVFWDTFTSVVEARKRFDKAKSEMGA